MKKPFKHIGGRDLSFEIECTCADKKWADDKKIGHLFKTKVRLSGYADAYFFDQVNKEPKPISCDCGNAWMVQWFRDGVEVNKVSKDNEHVTHTDHPMRHWDRTCPACVEQAEKQEPVSGLDECHRSWVEQNNKPKTLADYAPLYTAPVKQETEQDYIKRLENDFRKQLDELSQRNYDLRHQPRQVSVSWKHDCAALLQNGIELWIDQCPHCGKPSSIVE